VKCVLFFNGIDIHVLQTETKYCKAKLTLGRALPEKLTVAQLVMKFTTFYGTRRFITVFTTAHHWNLS